MINNIEKYYDDKYDLYDITKFTQENNYRLQHIKDKGVFCDEEITARKGRYGGTYGSKEVFTKIYKYIVAKNNVQLYNLPEKENYIYLIKTKHGVKIGKSKNAERRIKSIMYNLPFKEYEASIYVVENMHRQEKEILQELRGYQIKGEWFEKDVLPLWENIKSKHCMKLHKRVTEAIND